MTKKEQWQKTISRVERTKDRLGKGIDKDIREAVTAFNLLGINTTGSCAGHLRHRTGTPYIDVEAEETAVLDKRLIGLKDGRKREKIIAEIERKNLEERRKVMRLLDDFYGDRREPYDRQIIISGLARGWSRMESQGVDLQKILPVRTRKEKLKEYQAEMRALSLFLKNRFFGRSGKNKRSLQK